MTANQIEYAKLLEQVRSNRTQEALTAERDRRKYEVDMIGHAETGRHNLATEGTAKASLDEQRRANQAQEQIRRDTLSEQVRSNQAQEAYRAGSLDEQRRSNAAQEALRLQQLAEEQRRNAANESLQKVSMQESERHNRELEDIQKQMTSIQQQRANEEAKRTQVSVDQLEETRRHNKQQEANSWTSTATNAVIDMLGLLSKKADTVTKLLPSLLDSGRKTSSGRSYATAPSYGGVSNSYTWNANRYYDNSYTYSPSFSYDYSYHPTSNVSTSTVNMYTWNTNNNTSVVNNNWNYVNTMKSQVDSAAQKAMTNYQYGGYGGGGSTRGYGIGRY